VDTKKRFSPLFFSIVVESGSEIGDLRSGDGKNQDPPSGTRDKHTGSATLIVTVRYAVEGKNNFHLPAIIFKNNVF
jgi:hypothetical protein